MSRIIINGHEIDLDKVTKDAEDKSKEVEIKERREVFSGELLEVTGLCANVDIQPSKNDKLSIIATGPAHLVEQLQISNNDGTISISSSQTENGNHVTIGGNVIANNIIGTSIGGRVVNRGSISNGMTIISGDDVIINTGDSADTQISLKITAPLYTEVDIARVAGNIVIGDLQGDIDLDMSGQNSARITNVRDLDLSLSGQCEAMIEQISGGANVDVSGNSKVNLRAGYAENLDIDASGMSSVEAQITAKRAKLDASGMSRIYVKNVTGRCRKDSSGMSSIVIG